MSLFKLPILVLDHFGAERALDDLAALCDVSPTEIRRLRVDTLSPLIADDEFRALLTESARLLLLGSSAAAALRRVRKIDLPMFAELRLPGAGLTAPGPLAHALEVVHLPHPTEVSEAGDMVAGAVLRKVVRNALARVVAYDRREVYIGKDRAGFWYDPATGEVQDVQAEIGDVPTAARRGELIRLLTLAAARMPRWAGHAQVTVGAHCLEVAARAVLVARKLGASMQVAALAGMVGARHDLHEALPAIGDVPSPVVRLLRAFSPEWAHIERAAVDAAESLVGPSMLEGDSVDLVREAVKIADADCAAIERALCFGDAPAWLGERGVQIAKSLLGMPPLGRSRLFEALRAVWPDVHFDLVTARGTTLGELALWAEYAGEAGVPSDLLDRLVAAIPGYGHVVDTLAGRASALALLP